MKHGKIVKPTGGELHLCECGEDPHPCIRITIIHPPDPNQPQLRTTLAITVNRVELASILTDMEL